MKEYFQEKQTISLVKVLQGVHNLKFCSLSSCSYANSVVIQDEQTCILIDCGLRKRDIKPFLGSVGLSPSDLDAVLITHCHMDHVYGLKYILAEKDLPVYTTGDVWRELISHYHFKKQPQFVELQQEVEHSINSLQVIPYQLSHDVATTGYLIKSGPESLGYMTDTGYVPDNCLQAFQLVDYLYIESNHDVAMYEKSRKPMYVKKRNLGPNGHLSNAQCGQALQTMRLPNCKLVVLAHLSEEDNDPAVALSTARSCLAQNIRLAAAPSRVPGRWSDQLLKSTI